MRHRHLNHERYSLAAIDDVIARGHRADWRDLRDATRADRSLFAKIRQVCTARRDDLHAQRHRLWMLYAEQSGG